MIHAPDKKKIAELRSERDGAWVCFRDLCTRSGRINKEAVDSAKAAANQDTLKQVVRDHPIATLTAAAVGTAIAVKLIKKLPFKKLGTMGLSIGMRMAIMRMVKQYSSGGAEDAAEEAGAESMDAAGEFAP